MLKTPRAAVLLVFTAFGLIAGSHAGSIPVIAGNASVTNDVLGVGQGIAMLAALIAMALGSYISRRFDHRAVMLTFIPASLLALINALLVQSPMGYIITVVLLASCLSFVDLNMNAEAAAIEEEVEKPIFTMFHAAVSLAMAVAAIVASFLSVQFGAVAAGALAFIFGLWAIVEVWRLIPKRKSLLASHGSTGPALPFGRLTLVGLTIGLSNSCEVVSIIWAGQLLTSLAPALIAYSGLGLAFFGLCAGLMRLFGDRIRTRFGEVPVMIAALALATAGFAVLGLSPGFTLSVLAFAAVGAGIAPVFPGLYSMAGRLAPRRRAAAMGVASAISSGPRFVTPIVLGWLAVGYGLHTVFAVSAVMALLSLLLIAFVLAPFSQGETEEGASSC